MKRRRFIQSSMATAISLSHTPFYKWPAFGADFVKLTILHTNDTHSRIDPIPLDGSRNAGLGGAAKRAALISKIRASEPNVLLLDSGDIFQGTPYFNYFLGELEFKLMSQMGYDVATIGNHDFDAGLDNLSNQMAHADFSMVSANYDFSNTPMHDKVKPYKIIEVEGVRIGICGVGVELEGLVATNLYGETQYMDPIREVNKTASILKKERGCHYVICLSHIGYRYRNNRVSDIMMAENSSNVDIILGGHTHTFMNEPDRRRNLDGQEVLIHQVGWAGIFLGRIDLVFERNFKSRCETCQAVEVN